MYAWARPSFAPHDWRCSQALKLQHQREPIRYLFIFQSRSENAKLEELTQSDRVPLPAAEPANSLNCAVENPLKSKNNAAALLFNNMIAYSCPAPTSRTKK